MNIVYNTDCMQGMKEYPDKYFDLAIVDPVYGGVTLGGYMLKNIEGRQIGNGLGKQKGYHSALWQQEKTNKEYFDELFRVSQNQVIWGGIILSKKYTEILNAGSCGIRNTRKECRLRIANWRGLRSTPQHAYSGTYGMKCCRKI